MLGVDRSGTATAPAAALVPLVPFLEPTETEEDRQDQSCPEDQITHAANLVPMTRPPVVGTDAAAIKPFGPVDQPATRRPASVGVACG